MLIYMHGNLTMEKIKSIPFIFIVYLIKKMSFFDFDVEAQECTLSFELFFLRR